ncbi:hypothetical protein AAE250_16290 [Bacteroides sp. GD17]|jgi:hypothetical protein|uniref:hypothetical protein n=1 Tax=Bacteroides sp. GD17 TaxID=3139826 RepID=UPI0025CCD87C|nr:hypothetical protein [uncultured Bacteroides sp.]
MNDLLIYELPNTKGLHEIFSIVNEIGSELGMYPDRIELKDGRSVSYNRNDAKKLGNGSISEEAYIEKNQI